MTSIYCWEYLSNQVSEILTSVPFSEIREFYVKATCDRNPRTLSYMLSTPMTLGFVLGTLQVNNPDVYTTALKLINKGEQEKRDRAYDRKLRESKTAEVAGMKLSGLSISL